MSAAVMTDCSSFRSSTNSTLSDLIPSTIKIGSTTNSSSTSSKNTRIRIVRLNRNRSNLTRNFGFSLRGGKEFGTGFFVSHVEKGSEADLKGLKTGDEIYQVNGYKVSDAVHRELSKYIAIQDRITLRVRGVGIIPVKEYATDPLSWQVIGSKQAKTVDNLERIMLTLAPKMKLGCGICKGPEWKPGIFVQFTKENGVARNAGLRPGDQILACNGHDFTNIAFTEAVSIMKESHTLDLLVRVSEGVDLFPNESSGYNSSASSATGDQSPCWGNEKSKRLSIVREESNSSGDRKINIRSKGREIKRSLKQVPAPKVPPRSKTTQISSSLQNLSSNQNKGLNNTTIIKLSENGTLINNILISNYGGGEVKTNSNEATQMLSQSMGAIKIDEQTYSKSSEKHNELKTIKVEVHQSASTQNHSKPDNGKSIPAPPPPKMPLELQSTASSISVESGPDTPNETSLKCALFEEIRKRAEKKELDPENGISKLDQIQAPAKKGTGFSSNNKQHDALMEEFKLAHKRMFKNGFIESEKEREEHHVAPPPAPTPTPDYDSTPQNSLRKSPSSNVAPSTLHRVAVHESAKAIGEVAEMESIKSFQFNGANMGSSPPKFPQQFFVPRATGPATIKKANPQVAVKIDEFQNRADVGGQKNPSPAKRTLKPNQITSVLSNGQNKDVDKTNGTKAKNKVTIVVPNTSKDTNGHS
uniref:CSON007568 protein n=1 Tax=Culicoides sonorensis TaxID=179676 RepID=A0A336LXM3_CULSO